MKFVLNKTHISLSYDGLEMVIPLQAWLQLNPEFVYDPTADYEQWTPDLHYKVVGGNQQAAELPDRSELFQQQELQRYSSYLSTEIPEIQDPANGANWSAFRSQILSNAAFEVWSSGLPPTHRENLKIAAALGNAVEVQAIYDALTQGEAPEGASEWQAIANEFNIPLVLA